MTTVVKLIPCPDAGHSRPYAASRKTSRRPQMSLGRCRRKLISAERAGFHESDALVALPAPIDAGSKVWQLACSCVFRRAWNASEEHF